MIKVVSCDIKSFCYVTVMLGVLQLVSCWSSSSNDVLEDLKYEDIDLTSKRNWNSNLKSWGKRSWQNLQGGWGKRSNDLLQYSEDKRNQKNIQEPTWYENDVQNDSNFPQEEGVSIFHTNTNLNKDSYYNYSDQDNEQTLEDKRGWNRLPSWGKRSNWSNINGSRFKKDPAWTNLKGIWGKRIDEYHDDQHL